MPEITRKTMLWVQCLRADRRAVTAVEFAMIAALIAMVAVTVMTGCGRGVAATFNASAAWR